MGHDAVRSKARAGGGCSARRTIARGAGGWRYCVSSKDTVPTAIDDHHESHFLMRSALNRLDSPRALRRRTRLARMQRQAGLESCLGVRGVDLAGFEFKGVN